MSVDASMIDSVARDRIRRDFVLSLTFSKGEAKQYGNSKFCDQKLDLK